MWGDRPDQSFHSMHTLNHHDRDFKYSNTSQFVLWVLFCFFSGHIAFLKIYYNFICQVYLSRDEKNTLCVKKKEKKQKTINLENQIKSILIETEEKILSLLKQK